MERTDSESACNVSIGMERVGREELGAEYTNAVKRSSARGTVCGYIWNKNITSSSDEKDSSGHVPDGNRALRTLLSEPIEYTALHLTRDL